MKDSLSDGRKIFRLFKEFREVYKACSEFALVEPIAPWHQQVRRGWSRFCQGAQEHGTLSVPAICGVLDMSRPKQVCSFHDHG